MLGKGSTQVVFLCFMPRMMILNGFVRYADQTLLEKDQVSYFVCHMEGFGVSQLFSGIAPLSSKRLLIDFYM